MIDTTRKNFSWRLELLAKFFILSSLLTLVPVVASAAVIFSEVAWMGTEISANDEWIELYNDGDSKVAVDGWILTDGDKLEIKLAGAIGAGQYAVLERTNDDSAPGAAFLIYAGALNNTGSSLKLKNSVGEVIDELDGGDNWQNIGGSNKTKETAQRTVNGWITGEATPGEPNVVEEESRSSEAAFSFAKTVSDKGGEEGEELTFVSNSQLAAVVETEAPNITWPYFGLLGILLFSSFTVLAAREK